MANRDRWRCEDYLRWVAGQPCISCRREQGVQAHHIKGVGGFSGSSLRAPDHWTMPLCYECHGKLHRMPEKEMVAKQYEWAARTMGRFIALMYEGLGDEMMTTIVRGVARHGVIGGRI